MWSHMYEFSSTLVTKGKDRFFVPVLGKKQMVSEDVWPTLASLATTLRESKQALMKRNSEANTEPAEKDATPTEM